MRVCVDVSFRDLSDPHSFVDPTDRRYRTSHEWAKLDGDVATVGITEHAQAALGEIVFAELPEKGAEAEAGGTAATLESVKAAADIYAPVDGEVVEVNAMLEDAPELINTSPHDDGWMFRIKLSDATAFDQLMDAAAYEKTIETDD